MNNKIIFLVSVLFVLTIPKAVGQNIFSIEDVIQRAKNQSPASKEAETRKETSYWQYRYFNTSYNPQLVLSGNAPTYSQQYISVQQPDGSIVYRPINQTNPGVNLGLEQPIRWTGGKISANTSLNYFNNISSSYEQWSGQVLNVQLSQPIFAFNAYKWNRKIQPFVYEESRRAFVEQSEFISRLVAGQFFDVLLQQINAQIAEFNLANNDTIYKIEQGRYNMGTTSKDKLLQVELQLLRSRQDVAQAKLDLQTNRLRLRTFMGLNDGDEFTLIMPDSIPQFEVGVDEALQYARQNRADYIAFERRRIEAERDVAQAKGSRFATSLNATYGLNNSAPFANDIYVNPQKQQTLNVGFVIPVLNWGRNRASMQTALANKRLNDYIIAQDEVNFEQTIITQVLQFAMLRLQIEITKKSDEVAQERYNVSQNRYLIGKIDITNLNIALTEKDNAKRSYVVALKAFWTAYYDLRRLTLYDFATKQLLYKPE
jgi:outer membrane protein TolC